MKKTVTVIAVIELFIISLVFLRYFSFSFSEEIDPSALSMNDDLSEISSPDFSLKLNGIYELTVGYELTEDTGEDISVGFFSDDEDRYAIDTETVYLKDYRKSCDLRIYCGNSNVTAKAVIQNRNSSEHTLTVNGIALRYLNRKTAAYYSLCLLFWIIAADALLLICFKAKHGKIEPERLKTGFFLAVVFLLTNLPMYVDYLPGGHDLGFHLLRISGIAEGLSGKAQFPVRIHSSIYNGYGYAMGVCYGDSLLYLPALLYTVGFPLRQAYKAYIFFINLITVMGSYFCFYKISENRQISFLGSLVYSLSVWRLTDIYTRAALGEYSSMAFLPFTALGFYYLFSKKPSDTGSDKENRKKGILSLAFGYAGMIQVHVLSVIITGIFSVLFCLINIKKLFREKRFTDLIIAAFICLALSAGVLVPLADYYITQPMRISADPSYIQGKGAYPAQLLSTFFNTTESAYMFNSDTRMAFEMPMSIGLASMIVLLAALYLLLAGKIKEMKNELIETVILAVLSLFLTLTVFPYDWIADRLPAIYKVLGAIQFPFRFLIISALLSAAALVFMSLNLVKRSGFEGRLLLTVICLVAVWQGIDYMSKYINENRYFYIANDAAEQDVFSYDINEYLPENASSEYAKHNTSVDADEAIQIKSSQRRALEFDISVNNTSLGEAGLEVPVFAYKGFEALT
ncbi:MAG: hypothetical protein K5770_09765, partial [Lachnospiraceae bacterium]|nr:hypothetical protein [Lachnospiraceae bacterium]